VLLGWKIIHLQNIFKKQTSVYFFSISCFDLPFIHCHDQSHGSLAQTKMYMCLGVKVCKWSMDIDCFYAWKPKQTWPLWLHTLRERRKGPLVCLWLH